MAIYKNKNGLTYSGAGVLIIEDYYTKNGNIVPCILLARNHSSQLFMDFGGTYEDKHGSLKITAAIELQEESRNLFNISSEYLINYVDVPHKIHFYRIYLIKINGVSSKYYNHNMRLIEKKYKEGIHVSHPWRETDMISHIPIENINWNIMDKRGKITIKDINNNLVTLHTRTKNVIFYAYSLILNNIDAYPLASKKNITIYHSNGFKNNTYSFVIK